MSKQKVIDELIADFAEIQNMDKDGVDRNVRRMLSIAYSRGKLEVLEERNKELRRQLKGVSA
jgi:hypothetical protein